MDRIIMAGETEVEFHNATMVSAANASIYPRSGSTLRGVGLQIVTRYDPWSGVARTSIRERLRYTQPNVEGVLRLAFGGDSRTDCQPGSFFIEIRTQVAKPASKGRLKAAHRTAAYDLQPMLRRRLEELGADTPDATALAITNLAVNAAPA